MTETVTLQELFDSQACFSPKDVGLLFNDFDKLYKDHMHETENDAWSAKYHEGLKAIADKYDLEYQVPKHLGKLTEVGSSPVLH